MNTDTVTLEQLAAAETLALPTCPAVMLVARPAGPPWVFAVDDGGAVLGRVAHDYPDVSLAIGESAWLHAWPAPACGGIVVSLGTGNDAVHQFQHWPEQAGFNYRWST